MFSEKSTGYVGSEAGDSVSYSTPAVFACQQKFVSFCLQNEVTRLHATVWT